MRAFIRTASALAPLLTLGLATSCARSPEESDGVAPRLTDLRSWTNLSSMLEPGFNPRKFDDTQETLKRALWLEGKAQVLVEAEGVGTVIVTARRDGLEATEIGRFNLKKESWTTRVFDLSGIGPRELELELRCATGSSTPLGQSSIQWGEITLIESIEDRTVAEVNPAAAPLSGRNVILIVADSLYARHLGAYGYERPTSPTLDRLAETGVLFGKAYSQTSWTLSSVSSLFTSHQQERHGVLELNQRLDDRFETLAELFKAEGYRTAGLIQNGILWKETGLGQGFDVYETFSFEMAGLNDLVARSKAMIAEEAEAPLFLYVHFTPPHQPYQPPTSYIEQFVDPDYDGPVDGSILSCGLINRDKPPIDSPDVQHLSNLYDAHIRFADDQIGSLLTTAHERAELEDTLVIFTSDHGEAFMQHGAQGHNAHVFEEMVNVPLIFSAPGSAFAKGQQVETPVSLLDVMPTLIELFGLGVPAPLLDGISLVPYLAPDAPHRPERTLFYSSRYKDELARVQFGVRADGYKLVVKKGVAKLFDLSKDKRELNDLSGQLPIRTQALWCRLGEWWRTARAEGVRSQSSEPTQDVLDQLEGLGYMDTGEEEH